MNQVEDFRTKLGIGASSDISVDGYCRGCRVVGWIVDMSTEGSARNGEPEKIRNEVSACSSERKVDGECLVVRNFNADPDLGDPLSTS